jgi:hypothetical protein
MRNAEGAEFFISGFMSGNVSFGPFLCANEKDLLELPHKNYEKHSDNRGGR